MAVLRLITPLIVTAVTERPPPKERTPCPRYSAFAAGDEVVESQFLNMKWSKEGAGGVGLGN